MPMGRHENVAMQEVMLKVSATIYLQGYLGKINIITFIFGNTCIKLFNSIHIQYFLPSPYETVQVYQKFETFHDGIADITVLIEDYKEFHPLNESISKGWLRQKMIIHYGNFISCHDGKFVLSNTSSKIIKEFLKVFTH